MTYGRQSVNIMVFSPPERTSTTWLAYTNSQMRDRRTCFSVLWLSLRLIFFSVHGGLTHHGVQATADEDLSPTLEKNVVVLRLQLIHPGLPLLVRQKYGSELCNKTLASLKPEISQALCYLLDQLRSIEDTKAMCIGSTTPRSRPNSGRGHPDDALSCPASSAKPQVVHITLIT